MTFLQAVSVVAAILAVCTQAYPDGAPTSACKNLLPVHGAPAQTSNPSYTFTSAKTTYSPGESIQVTLSGGSLRGYMITARRTDGTVNPVGTWSAGPGKTLTCSNVPNAAVTQTSIYGPTPVTFTWTAPSSNEGDVQFLATAVQTEKIFWTGIKSSVLTFSDPNAGTPTTDTCTPALKTCLGSDAGVLDTAIPAEADLTAFCRVKSKLVTCSEQATPACRSKVISLGGLQANLKEERLHIINTCATRAACSSSTVATCLGSHASFLSSGAIDWTNQEVCAAWGFLVGCVESLSEPCRADWAPNAVGSDAKMYVSSACQAGTGTGHSSHEGESSESHEGEESDSHEGEDEGHTEGGESHSEEGDMGHTEGTDKDGKTQPPTNGQEPVKSGGETKTTGNGNDVNDPNSANVALLNSNKTPSGNAASSVTTSVCILAAVAFLAIFAV